MNECSCHVNVVEMQKDIKIIKQLLLGNGKIGIISMVLIYTKC